MQLRDSTAPATGTGGEGVEMSRLSRVLSRFRVRPHPYVQIAPRKESGAAVAGESIELEVADAHEHAPIFSIEDPDESPRDAL